MPSFLFIISFLLHIILLAAVYYLFQQIQLLKKNNTKELTDLFETYLKEIKNENQRLQDEISLNTSQHQKQDANIHEQIYPAQNIADTGESLLQTNNVNDKFETSLEAQVLQLHNQGIEVEEIAKKLSCGKTEAELIIKLQDKEKHKA